MNIESNHPLKCTRAMRALEDVYDPEIGLNVIDLGLIYRIDFDDENKSVHCIMTLTTQHCPMGESIISNVENALRNSFSDHTVRAELSFDPPWSYERISESGKEFLKR